MGKEVNAVLFKPDSQATDEYMVVVDPVEYNKFKGGDTSIAPAVIVDSYRVFHSSTGHTGTWGEASKQQLDSVFNPETESKKGVKVDPVQVILEKGTLKTIKGFASNVGDTNMARGSGDTRLAGHR